MARVGPQRHKGKKKRGTCARAVASYFVISASDVRFGRPAVHVCSKPVSLPSDLA